MAKRFTATTKWSDPWFCSLESSMKLFWIYLLDNCSHAGIWEPNWPLVEFHLHIKKDSLGLSEIYNRIDILKNGKWFIPKFIEFQYGDLNSENRAHQSVISMLIKEGAYKGHKSSLQGAKDKDKDKEMVKDKEKGDFDDFWDAYPKKVGKTAAKRKWDQIKPDMELKAKILRAVYVQRKSDQWAGDGGKYIPHPATWLNQGRWEDELINTRKPAGPSLYDKIVGGQNRTDFKPEAVGGLPRL